MSLKSFTLRQLQTMLPWTVKYSQDFRSNPQSHKDFSHALLHAGKALGKLMGLADDMDHDRELATTANLRDQYGNYVADLIICALRAANTFPGGVIDIEGTTVRRIEDKNGVSLGAPSLEHCPPMPPVKKPVTDFGCATDDTCGFPLHLPPTGGPTYPPHYAVKISGDSTECMDCGQRWDTNDPEPPTTCTPRDPMKYMFDAGFTDFPFKRPEVTSEKMHLMEQVARKLFAEARCFKVQDETLYEVSVDQAYGAITDANAWMHETPFISNGHEPVDELERLVALLLPKAAHSKTASMEFCLNLIRWCERNPLA